jgi:tRNA A37 threonylcarbamoyladenosine synthetase subunit TsaC/SUA5/YrdC
MPRIDNANVRQPWGKHGVTQVAAIIPALEARLDLISKCGTFLATCSLNQKSSESAAWRSSL